MIPAELDQMWCVSKTVPDRERFSIPLMTGVRKPGGTLTLEVYCTSVERIAKYVGGLTIFQSTQKTRQFTTE